MRRIEVALNNAARSLAISISLRSRIVLVFLLVCFDVDDLDDARKNNYCQKRNYDNASLIALRTDYKTHKEK